MWSSATQDGDVLCDAQQVMHVHERVLYLMRLMTTRAFDVLFLVCQELRFSRRVGGQFPAWKIFAKFEDLPGRAATKVRAWAKERHLRWFDEAGGPVPELPWRRAVSDVILRREASQMDFAVSLDSADARRGQTLGIISFSLRRLRRIKTTARRTALLVLPLAEVAPEAQGFSDSEGGYNTAFDALTGLAGGLGCVAIFSTRLVEMSSEAIAFGQAKKIGKPKEIGGTTSCSNIAACACRPRASWHRRFSKGGHRRTSSGRQVASPPSRRGCGCPSAADSFGFRPGYPNPFGRA